MMRWITTLGILACLVTGANAQVNGYYRHPDIHNNTIVFSAEGDLWLAPAEGGTARRLTTHNGEETWPVFSPDGTQVAFRAEYEGSADVYVMPVAGGTPQRITWDGRASTAPRAWTKDGRVVVSGFWTSGLPDIRLALVDPGTAAVEEVPLDQAAEAAYGDDGTLYFARMPRQGSNSRWYKGGLAQKLWKFAAGADEAVPLTTDYPGTSRQPNVLADGRIYFLSDRRDAMNIWSMAPDGSDLKRHTDYVDWDIQELASDGERLIYRLGADLWRMNPATGETTKLDIQLTTDLPQALTDWETEPIGYLSDQSISYDGSVVGLVARGELFTLDVDDGRLIHASLDSGVRYRSVIFSRDSLHAYGLSDRSGELEWWRVPVDGTGAPKQITEGPAMLRTGGVFSPDGAYLVHRDYHSGMWLVDVEDGSTRKIADLTGRNPVWMPDSKTVLYSHTAENLFSELWAYSVDDGTSTRITGNRFNDSVPHVSPDGNWLFFGSTRTWNSTVGSPWGERAPMPHFEDTGKIYAIPLIERADYPFSDADDRDSRDSADMDASSDMEGVSRWDLAHLLREVPVPAGSPRLTGVTAERLLYMEDGDLKAVEFEPDAEPVTVASGISSAELSGNGKRLLVRKGSSFHVIQASATEAKLGDETRLDLDEWKFAVDKRAEWNQIYHDMWRLHRDYFWDPEMGGVDWAAMRDKYGVLLPRVGSREALADLQGMLVSELSLLHSNAGGGDQREGQNQVSPSSLGGVFEKDTASGGFRLVHRYRADPDLPGMWSPLAHPDARVEEGETILSVNGKDAADVRHIGQLLMGLAGKEAQLEVLGTDGRKRMAVATPVSGRAEYLLRYHEWEYTRRLEADRRSDGQVGYVHLQAMGRRDAGQFAREFYSQITRQGMIIDVRHNNGGNIDSWILTQLMRRPWAYFKPRADIVYPNMQFSFGGHIVILVDERTASDGEAVADGFTRLDLGTSIGMRTWGGEVWLSSSNRQVDGGITRASETGVYNAEGEWLIEGWGYEPDIEVDNLPHETYMGRDAQLEAAVEFLLKKIEEDPRAWPDAPAYPELIPGSGFPTPWNR